MIAERMTMETMRKNIYKTAILIVQLLVIFATSCFLSQPSFADNNVKNDLKCRSQGATITEDYFIFTDYCGNGSKKDDDNDSITYIYRCDRSGSDFSNCEIIVDRAELKHANSLSYEWGSNHFWVFDGWCNPASEDCKRGQQEWCFDFNGKTADKSLCGVKPKNFSCDDYGTAQGYAQYGEYSLKGYHNSDSLHKIEVYNNKPINSDDCSKDGLIDEIKGVNYGELEDVMVDGQTGAVYYTISGEHWVKLIKATIDGYLPAVADTNSNKGNDNDTKEDTKKEKNDTDETTPTNSSTETDSGSKTVKTVFFGDVEDDGKGSSILRILKLVVEIMTIGVGILGVVGISIVGVQYLTAGGDEQRTTKAKRRLFEIVIGLAIYAVFWALVNWLLPGGIWSS